MAKSSERGAKPGDESGGSGGDAQEETTGAGQGPEVSIVIPVYNEEGILSASISNLFEEIELSDKLNELSIEVILAENGSVDRTVDVARKMMHRHPDLRMIHVDEPNYGRALKQGILSARGDYVICDEIDLCDTDFYERALYRLREEGYDMVVGSKTLERSFDKRPPYRRLATHVINSMLRVFVGFRGTDTHGLKAFKRDKLLDVLSRCVVERDMFASEFVIRAERQLDLRVTEIPVEVIEKRKPSIRLHKRVPNVLKNVARLTWHIRLRNR